MNRKEFPIKLWLVLALLWGVTLPEAMGQSDTSRYINYHERIIPETPRAAGFKQYGDIPVNHSTGVPQVSIPLFTLEEDGFTLPVSLSYHASGVLVDDLSNSVGLKWTINVGGGIFRTIKELPDEQGWLHGRSKGNIREYMDEHGDSYETHQTIRTSISLKDHYPDDFRYNIPGSSGSFYFDGRSGDEESSIPLKDRVLKPYKDAMRLEPYFTNNYLGFRAYDANGVRYIFGGDLEQNNNLVVSGDNNGSLSESNREYGTTGWMLDSIITKNGSWIHFDYVPYTLEYELFQTSQSIHQPYYCDGSMSFYPCGCEGDGVSGKQFEYLTSVSTIYRPINQLISSIDTESVHVSFEYVDDPSLSGWQRKLERIVLEDKYTGRQKSFELSYSSFSGDARLRLDAVQELGFEGEPAKPPHRFYYASGNLPAMGSKSKDYKGYYNGKSNTSLVPLSHMTNERVTSPVFRAMLADRSPDFSYMVRGTLERIEYPTGGATTFSYGVNATTDATIGNPVIHKRDTIMRVDESEAIGTSNGYTIYQQPFTVSHIFPDPGTGNPVRYKLNYHSFADDCDTDNANIDCALFNIIKMDPTSPIAEGEPVFETGKVLGNSGSEDIYSGEYIVEIKVPQGTSLSTANMGVELSWLEEEAEKLNYAGGLRVEKVEHYDFNGNLTGATQYEYQELVGNYSLIDQNIKIYGRESDFPKNIFSSSTVSKDPLSNKSGYFYKKVSILKLGAEDTLKTVEHYEEKLSTENYQGRLALQQEYKGDEVERERILAYNDSLLHTLQFWIVGDLDTCIAWQYLGQRGYAFSYPVSRTLYYSSGELIEETTHDYSLSTDLVYSTRQTYKYNAHSQIKRKESENSRGGGRVKRFIEEYTYPDDDYSELSFMMDEDTWLAGQPVSKLIYENDRLIFGQYFAFDQQGNVVRSYQHNRNALIHPLAVSYIPTDYELRNSFLLFNGLPIQVDGISGVPVSYVWSYGGNYPVAKVENATFGELADALGITTEQLKSLPVSDIPLLDQLREALPQALVTTYMYLPLVGITAVTDPNGITTEYHYDQAGRLEHVTDHEANTLQSLRYHYYKSR